MPCYFATPTPLTFCRQVPKLMMQYGLVAGPWGQQSCETRGTLGVHVAARTTVILVLSSNLSFGTALANSELLDSSGFLNQ